MFKPFPPNQLLLINVLNEKKKRKLLTNTLSVNCVFVNGSDTQECMVVFVGELKNITTSLIRNNSETFMKVTINVTVNDEIFCFIGTKVFGYDIESNGSIGMLAIPGVLNRTMDTFCEKEEDTISREFTKFKTYLFGIFLHTHSIINMCLYTCRW